MLVLSRKAGERISIGPEIEVTVLGIHKGRVKLGFLGPPEVPIHREELQRRIGPNQASHLAFRSRKATDAKGV
jgi:carbon storage regulator